MSSATPSSGVIYFWTSGEWGLALVVFVATSWCRCSSWWRWASWYSARRRSRWPACNAPATVSRGRSHRTLVHAGRLRRLIDRAGQDPRFANIHAGIGIAAFGAVVVLTMLASLAFDPRL
jgi:paraquat-inducible protein A